MRKFLLTKIKVTFDGLAMDVDGYVSEGGATRLFLEETIPFYLVDALGKEVLVKFQGIECLAVMILETLRTGAFYGIKFISLSPEDREKLRELIETDGQVPAWSRKYPRIPVDENQDDLPVPSIGVVFVPGGAQEFVNVVNFSLEGIRFETYGDALSDIRVGHRLNFDLITNTGEFFRNFNGEVLNLYETGKVASQGVPARRAMGVKFVTVPKDSEQKYIALIRDYCLAFKKKFDLK